eukprot:359001_1
MKTQYGCVWSVTDHQCMCNADDIGINVIYLVDISLHAMLNDNDYDDIAHIIDDQHMNSHSLIVLYDDNVYIQNTDMNASNVDVSQIERTQTNHLVYAIDTALNHFILFNNNNRRVLVIFNGEAESHYPDDPSTVCAKRGELERNRVSVIINSYVRNGIEPPRDLECLMSVHHNEAYNVVPYLAIHGVSTRNGGWDGFPIQSKLSWDICQAANVEDVIVHNVPLRIEPIDTPIPTVADTVVSSPTPATKQAKIPSRVPTRYLYKPRITPRPPLCHEPKEICTDAQIFNAYTCKCECTEIDSDDSICPDRMVYDPASCQCEVYPFNNDLDVLFVIDSSCGLDAVSCESKAEFVSHLAQIITANGEDPRVGVMQCGETIGSEYTIPLEDDIFNQINSDVSLDRLDAFDLFFSKIRSELQCASGAAVPKGECLQEAVSILNPDAQADATRVRKIVLIEICGVMEGQEPCDAEIHSEWSHDVNAKAMDIMLVQIGDGITQYNHECLLSNGAQSVYRFDSFDFNLLPNIEMTTRLVDGICGTNQLGIGETVEEHAVGAVSNRDREAQPISVAPLDQSHTLAINNPLPIPRSDEHNNAHGNGNDNDSSDQGNVHEVIQQESDSSHQYIQVNTNVKIQSDSSGNNVRRTKQMRGRGRGRGRVVNYGSGSSSDSSD